MLNAVKHLSIWPDLDSSLHFVTLRMTQLYLLGLFKHPLKDVAYYRRKFSRRTKLDKIGLGVSQSAGEAPNKPVLLLSVIELIHWGEIK